MVETKGSTLSPTSTTVGTKSWLYHENALLIVLIILVWSLLTLPAIFYHLPRYAMSSNASTNRTAASICSASLQDAATNENGTTVAILECTEGFYQENGSNICTPSCHTWTQYSKGLSTFYVTMIFIAALIGSLAASAVIIISCLLHKRMLIFPSIFVVYLMVDSLVSSLTVMVGYTDRNKLFCSSRNLIESMREVTTFCVLSGILNIYVLFQLALWWIFHITTLFWKVVFPLHARSFGKVKIKYLHITCIILGILLPFIPIITSMVVFAVDIQNQNENSTSGHRNSLFLSGGLGFGPTRLPHVQCLTSDPNAIFYSFALIVDIIMACGCTMFLIIMWTIHRLYKEKRLQNTGKVKIREFGTPEKKLFIVFCYYIILALLFISQFTAAARGGPQLKNNIQKYFCCEQGGYNPSNPCSRSEIEDLNSLGLEILLNIFGALFPVVNLIYAVDIQELKQVWRKIAHKPPL